jgi:hypothetical protein
MMRRIVLVLALTALLVAVALAGSALGQPVTEQPGCGGLGQAATAQAEPAPQPPPREEKEEQFPDRSQGEVHSVVPVVQSTHGCVE